MSSPLRQGDLFQCQTWCKVLLGSIRLETPHFLHTVLPLIALDSTHISIQGENLISELPPSLKQDFHLLFQVRESDLSLENLFIFYFFKDFFLTIRNMFYAS